MLTTFYVAHKVRRAYFMLFRISDQIEKQIDNLFRQMEALIAIYVTLGLRKSLPTTRVWAASPDFLHHLIRHAIDNAPRVIVECGSGVSTVVLARCVQINGSGHVFSLEHAPAHANNTRRALESHGLGDWATVLDSPLRPHRIGGDDWLWYSEDVLPREPIDMLVVDGPPMETGRMARYPAGPLLFRSLSDRGTIFLDDASRQQETSIVARWVDEFRNLQCEFIVSERGCARLWIA